MQSIEQWRDVVGYEGIYKVSDHGQVKRVLPGKGTRTGILRNTLNRNGYAMVALSAENIQSKRLVHRLMLEAFVGPPPEGTEGCHNDDDPGNNVLSNLRWDTHQSNCTDRSSNGKPRKAPTLKTHCRNGHEYPEGVKVYRGARICKECEQARERRRRKYPNADNECRKGHDLSGDNLYIDPRGKRHCRACRQVAEERRKMKNANKTRGQRHGGKSF